MNTSPGASGADDVDRHRQHLDAVREAGPLAIAELLGDAHYVLANLVLAPGLVFDAEEHEPGEFVQLLDRIHEFNGALEGARARTEVALADSHVVRHRAAAMAQAAQEADAVPAQDEIDRTAEKVAGREISMIMRRSPSTAGRSLASSRRLVESMPEMLTALTTGKITSQTAYDTARSTAPLEPLARRQVDEVLGERLPDLDGAGRGRWRQAVTAAVEQVDPKGESARHQRARQERNVTVRPGEHGMATVSARMPSVEAVLMRKRLSLEAERLRAEGDRRGHQAIMADLLADTVLGREGGMDPITLDLGVIITDRALLNPKHGDVAHIEGYGPVPAEAVRAQLRASLEEPSDPDQDPFGPDGPALRAVLRRLYTHPVTGELVAVESEARAFPEKLGRFLTLRDSTCRGPFCDAPIRQHDHIVPHSRGGPTSVDNGQGLCAHCNQKEQQLRAVRRTDQPGHRVEWVSETGTRRVVAPTPLTAPEPPRAPRSRHTQPQVPAPTGPRVVSPEQSSSPEQPPKAPAEESGTPEKPAAPVTDSQPPPEGAVERSDSSRRRPTDEPADAADCAQIAKESTNAGKDSKEPTDPARAAKGPTDTAQGAEEPTKPSPKLAKAWSDRAEQSRDPAQRTSSPAERTAYRPQTAEEPEPPRRQPGRGRGIPRRERAEPDSGDPDAAAN